MKCVRVTIVSVEWLYIMNVRSTDRLVWLRVCVFVLFIQNAMRLRHIMLPNMACIAVPHSDTFYLKRYDFGEEIITRGVILFSLQLGLKLSQ